MKTHKIIALVLAFILTAGLFCACGTKDNEAVESMITGKSLNELETVMLRLENEGENIVYSPLSIRLALSMLYEGAEGNTAEQIKTVLGDISQGSYPCIEGVQSVGNALFIREGFYESILESYKETLSGEYNAVIEKDSFETADNINSWIEKTTLGLIDRLIEDAYVRNQELKLLLVNALAIDMSFEEPFDASATHKDSFFTKDGSTLYTAMMSLKTQGNGVMYYEDEGVTIVRIPLESIEDTQKYFYAVMPSEDLTKAIESFTIETLASYIDKLSPASDVKNGIEVCLPAFRFEYTLSLLDDLKTLGINDAFSAGLADFSKMADEKLYIGDAIHKATVEVSEEGVKASAVTAFGMKNFIVPGEEMPEQIIFNRPFLFFIADSESEEIWFTGAVYRPVLWEEYEKSSIELFESQNNSQKK